MSLEVPLQLLSILVAQDALKYHVVAASMLVFWDHIITLSEELRLLWRSKQSLASMLFYNIRYMGFAFRLIALLFSMNVPSLMHPTANGCVAWLWFTAVGGQLLLVCAHLLFILRVFALYGRNRPLMVILLLLFVCEIAAEISIIVLSVPKMTSVPNTFPPGLHLPACIATGAPKLFANFWIPGLGFQTLLFMLAAAHFVRDIWRSRTVASSRVLVVFIRDGTWTFVANFAVLLWTNVAFSIKSENGDVALNWIGTVLTISCSRLILNLRSAAQRPSQAPTYDEPVGINMIRLRSSPSAVSSGKFDIEKNSVSKRDTYSFS